MKKHNFLFLILILFLTACSKDATYEVQLSNGQVVPVTFKMTSDDGQFKINVNEFIFRKKLFDKNDTAWTFDFRTKLPVKQMDTIIENNSMYAISHGKVLKQK